jgi:hypothetical protein
MSSSVTGEEDKNGRGGGADNNNPPSLRMLASLAAGSLEEDGGDVEGRHPQQQQYQRPSQLRLDHLDSTASLGESSVMGGQQQQGQQGQQQEQQEEQGPAHRWLESNLWCWGRSQDGQAGAYSYWGLGGGTRRAVCVCVCVCV